MEAREKEVFGILINKANLTNYANVLERVKSLLTANNKRFYKFIISNLSDASHLYLAR